MHRLGQDMGIRVRVLGPIKAIYTYEMEMTKMVFGEPLINRAKSN